MKKTGKDLKVDEFCHITNLGFSSEASKSAKLPNSRKLFQYHCKKANTQFVRLVKKEAVKIAREYLKNQLHKYSSEYISKLKKDGIYPYKDKPESIVEESKRQVFDIVALQIHEFLPNFDEQELKTKKLTLSLIKEALEKDANTLRKILSEVIELPDSKREELVEILEETSLSNN